MSVQQCSRCNTEEYIPTHQYIKLSTKIADLRYLCAKCWEDLRHYTFHPQVCFPLVPGTIHCQRCNRQPLKNRFPVSFDNRDLIYCIQCYAELRTWFQPNPEDETAVIKKP